MIIRKSTGRPRGLAALSPERRREIASKGGRTSQSRGSARYARRRAQADVSVDLS